MREFKLGDKVRGEMWSQPFKGTVHAITGAGRGLTMIVIHGSPLKTPMWDDDGRFGQKETPTFSIIVRESDGRSVCADDWIDHVKEEAQA